MAWTFATKACHSYELKLSAPSPGFLESGTATLPLRVAPLLLQPGLRHGVVTSSWFIACLQVTDAAPAVA
jgi:hypothetical protein